MILLNILAFAIFILSMIRLNFSILHKKQESAMIQNHYGNFFPKFHTSHRLGVYFPLKKIIRSPALVAYVDTDGALEPTIYM